MKLLHKFPGLFSLTTSLTVLASTQALAGNNYAIIMGGSDYNDKNVFAPEMAELASSFQSKGWKTKVLFDSAKHKKDWDQFPKELRPPQPGYNDTRFTLYNYTVAVDQILAKKPGPGDQVEISLSAHGEVMDGHHIMAVSPIDPYTPEWLRRPYYRIWGGERTSALFGKMEKLLRRGVRVHFNVNAAYDGQVVNEIEPLLSKFPDLLCVTTATTSQWPSTADRNFVGEGLTRGGDGAPASVVDLMKRSTQQQLQTSALPGWMTVVESLNRHEESPDGASPGHPDVFDSLCHVDSIPLPEVRGAFEEKIRSILGKAEPTLEAVLKQLRDNCTPEYQFQLADRLRARLNELNAELVAVKVTVRPSEAPFVFNEKRGLDPEPPGSPIRYECRELKANGFSEYVLKTAPTVDAMRCDISAMDVEDEIRFLSRGGPEPTPEAEALRQKQLSRLREFYKTYPRLASTLASIEEKKKLAQAELGNPKCDQARLENLKTEIRAEFLDRAESESKTNPNSDPSKRLQACKEFKI